MTEPLIDPLLLEIMQCPACSGALEPSPAPPKLTCTACGLAYPVRDGIPVMLVEEATPSQPPVGETPIDE